MVEIVLGGAIDMVSWLLFVHVLSAMVWLGGGLTLMLAGFRARSSSRPEGGAGFAGAGPFVGFRVLIPAGVLSLCSRGWPGLVRSPSVLLPLSVSVAAP